MAESRFEHIAHSCIPLKRARPVHSNMLRLSRVLGRLLRRAPQFLKLATDCSLFISQVALPRTIECQAALERGDRQVLSGGLHAITAARAGECEACEYSAAQLLVARQNSPAGLSYTDAVHANMPNEICPKGRRSKSVDTRLGVFDASAIGIARAPRCIGIARAPRTSRSAKRHST